MSQTVSASAQRPYGLARMCKVWRLSRATVRRHRRAANRPTAPRRRPGPPGAMPDAELGRCIRALLEYSLFHGEGYRKVWPRLRYAGVRTSPPRVLRVMRAHDGTINTARVDEMWGTDITAVATGEGTAAVFIVVDHCSAECVGIHAIPLATRHEALEPIRQAV